MKRKKAGKILMILMLVFAVLMGGGFTYLYFNGMSGISNTTQAAEGQVKIACVGDSITYGHGISNWPKNNYPKLLSGLLGEGYHVQSFGVSGRAVQRNSDQPYTALKYYQNSIAYDADVVVFMMGTNDSKPENWHGEAAFEKELLALLQSYGDARVIVCTPAASYFAEGSTGNITSYDIQPEVVDTIAEITREIAVQYGYELIDIHALTSEHPEWFAKDGVHPNNDGAAAIAQEVCHALKKEK